MVTVSPTHETRLRSPRPEDVLGTQLSEFVLYCEQETGLAFKDQAAFYRFSVADYRQFWSLFLEWSGVIYEGSAELVCCGDAVESAEFFPDVRLNYVENLLASLPDRDDEPVIIAHHACTSPVRVTRRELRRQVIAVANAYLRLDLGVGDRVVAVSHNTEQLIVAGLAAMSVGATLSTASPDAGVDSILSRFEQLAPTLLLLGSEDPSSATGIAPDDRVHRLVRGLPSLTGVVVLDELEIRDDFSVPALNLTDLLSEDATEHDQFAWPRLPFNHPLLILFSSGTTGPPKCIVHSAGGVLLEHRKEHLLHEDLRSSDTLFFHTSPAWMMWNWQLSAIGTGATIVLYDGRVSEPGTLWSIVAKERVTAFGTGPSYLRFCETAKFCPRDVYVLSHLRVIMSTGSILRDCQFDWIVENVAPIPIHSISGGTDIVGCFVLGNPMLPVHRGECQCRSLALDVRSLRPDSVSGVGELVCGNPFPSRPLGLYGDADGRAFHDAYFAANEGVWTHGDLIEITERGSVRMHGRSDDVLNAGGVRIGPAEIYAITESIPGIHETAVVEQQAPELIEASRLVLLVVTTRGGMLDASLEREIRRRLARGASPTHVPRLIVEVPELPRTLSGKTSEAAVRDALNGVPVRNLQALKNPECLMTIAAATKRADERGALDIADAFGPKGGLDGTVEMLCTIFAELLGVAEVSPDDSFFDLGGTSLALASARLAIYDRLGRDIPLSAIFLAPRPRALAEYLRRPAQDLSDTLVLLKPGASDARPLFMIRDGSGDVISYSKLADSIPGTRPIYGVRAPIFDSQLRPDRTIDEMVDSAIASVRSLQDSGPYTLIGFSFGGIVAFEMARSLRAAGEEVDNVMLLDPYVDPSCLGRFRGMWFVAVNRPIGYARWLLNAQREDLARVGHRLLQRLVPRLVSASPLDQPKTPLARAAAMLSREVQKRYRPGRYAGDVVYFRAQGRYPFKCDPVPVWQAATEGRFSVVATAGGHVNSMALPNVEQLGRRIGSLLDGSEIGPHLPTDEDGHVAHRRSGPAEAGRPHSQGFAEAPD